MGWLEKLFGGAASVAGLRKAVEQKRFADARLLAEQLSEQPLEATAAAEVEQLRVAAGDGLARLNLAEALGMRNSGNAENAAEHLQLALAQVCSAALRQQIEQALNDTPVVPEIAGLSAGGKSCTSCAPAPRLPLALEAGDFPDVDSQVALVLTSYPPLLAERYRQKSEPFLQAFLLSHSGDDAAALPLWKQLAAPEQDDLYWFEFGSALARSGALPEARTALEQALRLNSELLLATESLVAVLLGLGKADVAQQQLQQLLAQGQNPAFCHAQLMQLFLQKQQQAQAAEQLQLALAAGVSDPAFLQLAARFAEQRGELGEAEALLQRIPAAGGCSGGGVSLPLAEFLLRQRRDLAKVLDTFNAACRQEPENPRWQLRVAQTYLARNWQKDGLKLLRVVATDPRLASDLRQEAELLLGSLQG